MDKEGFIKEYPKFRVPNDNSIYYFEGSQIKQAQNKIEIYTWSVLDEDLFVWIKTMGGKIIRLNFLLIDVEIVQSEL